MKSAATIFSALQYFVPSSWNEWCKKDLCHAQSAQLLVARHVQSWHAAPLSQTTSVTCVREWGGVGGGQSNFRSHLSRVSNGPLTVFVLVVRKKKTAAGVNENRGMTSSRRNKQEWLDFSALVSKKLACSYSTNYSICFCVSLFLILKHVYTTY